MKQQQRGSVIVGIIIGVVLGLAAALAVAVYVTKVPVPFLNKGSARSPEQDAAESRKNQNWDPNAPLYGRNPARALPPAPGAVTAPQAGGSAPAQADARPAAASGEARPAARSGDPLGELAAARAGISPGGDPFIYFVQAGAFRSADDAEAQRAKLSLMGIEARVTEREQSGRQVFRVRIGPFETKDQADGQKARLDASGFETALVRVQR